MKQFFARFSRRTWIIIGAAALIVLIIIIASTRGRNKVTVFQTAKLERGNLGATVGATGTVRARPSAVLNWQTTGGGERANVEVGSRVRRNQVLASLGKQSL